MKERVGFIAIMLGIIGAMFGVGGVEHSTNTAELLTAVGIAVSSLTMMYLGTILIKEDF